MSDKEVFHLSYESERSIDQLGNRIDVVRGIRYGDNGTETEYFESNDGEGLVVAIEGDKDAAYETADQVSEVLEDLEKGLNENLDQL